MVLALTRSNFIETASQQMTPTKKVGKPIITTDMNSGQGPLLQLEQNGDGFEQGDPPFLALHRQVHVAEEVAEQQANNGGQPKDQHAVERILAQTRKYRTAAWAHCLVPRLQIADEGEQVTFVADGVRV